MYATVNLQCPECKDFPHGKNGKCCCGYLTKNFYDENIRFTLQTQNISASYEEYCINEELIIRFIHENKRTQIILIPYLLNKQSVISVISVKKLKQIVKNYNIKQLLK